MQSLFSNFLVNSGRILLFGPRNKFHFIVIKLFSLLKQDFTVVIISRVEDTDFKFNIVNVCCSKHFELYVIFGFACFVYGIIPCSYKFS
jgi:hypothetical protein